MYDIHNGVVSILWSELTKEISILALLTSMAIAKKSVQKVHSILRERNVCQP